uniref:G protein-coupled receptor n=1 Tax=Echinococcus granulosus TaxID=6210 RepID=A0A068WFZ8_ECHGR|nr:hypothetical protein EgrG_000431400 [Echinococcus granulosus]
MTTNEVSPPPTTVIPYRFPKSIAIVAWLSRNFDVLLVCIYSFTNTLLYHVITWLPNVARSDFRPIYAFLLIATTLERRASAFTPSTAMCCFPSLLSLSLLSAYLITL